MPEINALRTEAKKMSEENVKEVAKLAVSGAEIRMVKQGNPTIGWPAICLPDGYTLQKLSDLIPTEPDRIRELVTMPDLESFVRYLKEFKRNARVFASVLQAPFGLTCVLDYHGDKPSWATHVCRLELTETEAWLAWSKTSGCPRSQEDFAVFLEERQPDVVQPSGADLLELARNMEATQGVSFKKQLRLDNGDVTFAFDDKTEATAGMNGKMTIPQEITLKVPIFLGMPEQAVKCRFKYRLQNARLMVWHEIVRRQELLLTTVKGAMQIVEIETEIACFIGDRK